MFYDEDGFRDDEDDDYGPEDSGMPKSVLALMIVVLALWLGTLLLMGHDVSREFADTCKQDNVTCLMDPGPDNHDL